MKHIVLILALIGTPLAAQERLPEITPPVNPVEYNDAEIVAITFGCALAAAAALTGPASAVAAGVVIAAGVCTIGADYGFAIPDRQER